MRHFIKSFGLLVIGALFVTACATKEEEVKEEVMAVDMEQVRTEIQAMEDAYAAGEKVKDADAVANYYSDDAVSYGQYQEPAVGKAAITAKIAKNIASDTTGGYSEYKIVDLYAEGGMVVEIGSWTRFDSSGKELEHGNYMSYFEKRDGSYKCVRDMSATTSPEKPMM